MPAPFSFTFLCTKEQQGQEVSVCLWLHRTLHSLETENVAFKKKNPPSIFKIFLWAPKRNPCRLLRSVWSSEVTSLQTWLMQGTSTHPSQACYRQMSPDTQYVQLVVPEPTSLGWPPASAPHNWGPELGPTCWVQQNPKCFAKCKPLRNTHFKVTCKMEEADCSLEGLQSPRLQSKGRLLWHTRVLTHMMSHLLLFSVAELYKSSLCAVTPERQHTSSAVTLWQLHTVGEAILRTDLSYLVFM